MKAPELKTYLALVKQDTESRWVEHHLDIYLREVDQLVSEIAFGWR